MDGVACNFCRSRLMSSVTNKIFMPQLSFSPSEKKGAKTREQ